VSLLDDLISRARKAGADAADAVLVDSAALSVAQRLGKPEKLERAESRDLGLRVFIGKRQAIVSTTDTSPAMLAELLERAVAMARSVPEDPYCGLAAAGELARKTPTIDLCDSGEPTTNLLKERARAAEESRWRSRRHELGRADAGWSRSTIALAASNGFAGAMRARITASGRRARRRRHGHGARLRLRDGRLWPRSRGCRRRRQAAPANGP